MKWMPDTPGQIVAWLDHFESQLESRLPRVGKTPSLLHQAMRYSVLAGGKRIRPLLVYATGEALGVDIVRLDSVACAIEIIHTYSLIHDDLPAMDDDDLRRGLATCHRRFDEATAILAGDALQALAFQVLSSDASLTEIPANQVALIQSIARACGSTGMAGGQVLDLSSIGQQITLEELELMHRLKTGALIQVCVTAPALIGGYGPEIVQSLQRYGECIGLAFQIHDDILDVTGTSEQTGKTTQADAARDKPTFPSVIGIDNSKRRALDLRDQAVAALGPIQGNCGSMAWLADYVVGRDR
jgi:farnesyl diphosphate synthase